MKDRIVNIVEDYWSGLYPALMAHVAETERKVADVLALETYYRTGYEGERLESSLGSFAAQTVDLRSLSSVLKQGGEARVMEKERYTRIRNIAAELEKVHGSLRDKPPHCTFADLQQGPEAILDAYETHIGTLAKAFRTLRIAELEARARYDAETHDPFFENFNWRQLEDTEMGLCPPFVVFSEAGEDFGDELSAMLRLVTSGKPVKVVVVQSRLDNGLAETGRAAALKSSTDLELLFISLRNVYFAQGGGATDLTALVHDGLRSPRPGVLSVLATADGDGAPDARAELALASRAFPHLVYDPDKAGDFVSCLDLADNPAPEAVWPPGELDYKGENGEPQHLERPSTFADFAAREPHLREQFTPVPEDAAEETLVPIADFLELPAAQRKDKRPFVHALDGQGRLTRLVPSQSIIAQTADKRHLWHTLQELGGIGNPFVQAAEQRTREALLAEKQQSLAEQKADLDAQLKAREQEAVAAAMKNLAMRLTGMAVAGPAPAPAAAPQPEAAGEPTPPADGTSEAAPAASPEATVAEAAPAPPSEEPWIDKALCTTCDECIAINKKLFAYDGDKKAYITDPRAGPYKDLVRAAEKCSSGAIHPGMPLDPDEKDVDKWIKRAEPYL